MYTYVKPHQWDETAFFVESWYDRSVRLWTTQLKNANLEQLGESVHSDCKSGARRVHNEFINGLSDGMPYIIEWFKK
jgi:hypothetical protein